MEVTSQLQNLPGKGLATLTSLTGEAVAVDLPGGRTLFALIGPLSNGRDLAGTVTKLFEPSAVSPEAVVASVGALGGSDQVGRTAVLNPEQYPHLVTFRDINNPKSIQAVDPMSISAVFDEEITIQRITVTLTNEKVTTGIEKQLEWLNEQRGALVSAVASDPLAQRRLASITEGDFTSRRLSGR
jgi:hypothetical protein